MKRTVFLYNVYQFFFSLLFWVPIFYEYQKHFGMSDVDIYRIQTLYYIVFALLEAPTGFMADWISYKFCLLIGSACLIAANLLPIFWTSYYGFLFHFILIALARSLNSGASSAYLYAYLSNTHGANTYKRFEGQARAYSLIGKVLCWSAIGFLMTMKVTLPYWLSVGSAALSTLFAFLLPRSQSQRGTIHMGVWKASFMHTITNPLLLLVMMQGVSIFTLVRILQVNLFQPILLQQGFSVGSLGVLMGVMTLFEAFGSAWSSYLKAYLTDISAVMTLTLVMGLSLLTFTVQTPTLTVGALFLFSLATGLSFPIQKQLMNDAILDSSQRATLLSIESIIDRTVCAVVASFIGIFLAEGQLNRFLMLSSGGTVLFTLATTFLITRRRRFYAV